MKRKLFLILSLIFHLFFVSGFYDGYLDPNLECCSNALADHKEIISNQDLILSEIKYYNEGIEETINSVAICVCDNLEGNNADIIDKFCDDWCSILGSILGAVLGGLIAIFVFLLGKRKDRLKQNRKLKDFGEQLYVITRNITRNSETQMELLDVFQKSIKDKPSSVGDYKRLSQSLLARVKSFEPDKIFSVFRILKFNNRDFIRYLNQIDFLEEIFRTIDDDYNNVLKEYITPYSNKFILLKKEFLEICMDYIEKKRQENDKKDKLFVFLNNFISDYYKSEHLPKVIDLSYDNDNLLRPLLVELLKSYRDNEISSRVIKLLHDASNTVFSIKQVNINLANDVETQIGNIKNSVEELKKIEGNMHKIYAD